MRGITIVSIILMYVFTILVDLYILRDIRTYCGRCRKLWMIVYGVISVMCLGLVSGIAFFPVGGDGSITLLMWMLYTYFSVYLPKLIYVVCSAAGRLFKTQRHGRKINYGAFAGIGIGLIICIMMWWGVLFTRNDIVVERVEVVSSKLPEAFNGYRIVQFSDAHVGTWGKDTTFISKLVDEINSLKPDLIVFTGDIVNRETVEMEPFLSVLGRLKAKDGVYSILGNHDYGDYKDWALPSDRDSNNLLMQAWQKQIGWKMLNNSHEFLTMDGDTLVLIGVENWGEPPFHQYGQLTKAYPGTLDSTYNLNDSRFKVLLSHNPEHWNREVSEISNIDLTLSGHTHAMQMVFNIFGKEWSPSEYKYDQWKGLYERDTPDGSESRIYVNIGCGEVGIPARFGSAYPEITELTLKTGSKGDD